MPHRMEKRLPDGSYVRLRHAPCVFWLATSRQSPRVIPEHAATAAHRAPLRVHDVVHVTVVPFSQAMQASTHCFMFFGS
jgi:hypothetical protein